MGKRGPRPHPPALKRLRGNPGGRRLPKGDPPEPPGAGIPPPPARLSRARSGSLRKRAAAYWIQYAPPLHERGLLTPLDLLVFEVLCRQAALAERAGLELEKDFSRPRALVYRDAVARLVSIAAEFGLTPSSRAGLTLPQAPVLDTPAGALSFADFRKRRSLEGDGDDEAG